MGKVSRKDQKRAGWIVSKKHNHKFTTIFFYNPHSQVIPACYSASLRITSRSYLLGANLTMNCSSFKFMPEVRLSKFSSI